MIMELIAEIREYLSKYIDEKYYGDITFRVQFQCGKIVLLETLEKKTKLYK